MVSKCRVSETARDICSPRLLSLSLSDAKRTRFSVFLRVWADDVPAYAHTARGPTQGNGSF